MAQRTGALIYPEETARPDGFGEVLTQMLLIAVVMLAIASALSLLTMG